MEERAKRPKQEAQRAQRCGVLEKGSQPLLTSYGVWAKLILFLFQWWRMRLVSPVYVTLESAVVSHGDDAVSSVCIFNFLEWILGLWGNENSLLRGLFATLSVCTQTVWLCTSACRLNDCTSVRLLAYRLWSYGCLVCTCVCTDRTSAGELRCWRECSQWRYEHCFTRRLSDSATLCHRLLPCHGLYSTLSVCPSIHLRKRLISVYTKTAE